MFSSTRILPVSKPVAQTITNNKTGALESYAIIHLLGSFLIAEIILALLITLTLNIGYGFRRDQKVIFQIRNRYLTSELYIKIFGTSSYNPGNKTMTMFLPEFNRMFVWAMTIIELLLLGALVCYLHQFINYNFLGHWFFSLLLLLPFAWTFVVYGIYWRKYKKVCC